RMHTIQPGYADYPRTLPILQTFQRIEHAFPAGPAPAQVVVETDDTGSARFAAAVRRFRSAALATGQAFDPVSLQVMSKHVAVVSLALAGDGQNDRSTAALQTLRSRVIPETLAGRAGIDQV